MKNLTIRSKLALWYAATILLFIAIIFAVFYFVLRETLLKQLYENLQWDIATIGEQVENEPNLIIDTDDIDAHLLTPGYMYALYDIFGKRTDGEAPLWADTLNIRNGEAQMFEKDGARWLVMRKPAYIFQNKLEPVGSLLVIIPAEPAESILNTLLRASVISLAFCVLFAIAGGIWIAGRALAPIHKIIDTIKKIREGNIEIRVAVPQNGDEIAVLSKAFNEMMDNRQKILLREQQFTSDVSHELRTPLAVILANAEEAIKDNTEESCRRAVKAIYKKGRDMQNMICQLLMLARGHVKAEKIRLDISAALEDMVEETTVRAKELHIKTNIRPDLFICGDPMLITNLFMNLLENAVRYNKPQGEIAVSADEAEGHVIITIRDTGKGIEKEHIPLIFERFYRADKSRAGEGSGLGLAIASQAAEIHGGSISVESETGRGSCFTVLLPLVK